MSLAAAVLENRLDVLLCRAAVRHHGNRTLLAHLRRERGALVTFLGEPGIPPTRQEIDGALIVEAASRAVELWPEGEQRET